MTTVLQLINGAINTMLSNVERRKQAVENRPETEHVEYDYDDGEIVLTALCEKVDEDFESFVETVGLDIRSGPKYVGVGVEVILA